MGWELGNVERRVIEMISSGEVGEAPKNSTKLSLLYQNALDRLIYLVPKIT